MGAILRAVAPYPYRRRGVSLRIAPSSPRCRSRACLWFNTRNRGHLDDPGLPPHGDAARYPLQRRVLRRVHWDGTPHSSSRPAPMRLAGHSLSKRSNLRAARRLRCRRRDLVTTSPRCATVGMMVPGLRSRRLPPRETTNEQVVGQRERLLAVASNAYADTAAWTVLDAPLPVGFLLWAPFDIVGFTDRLAARGGRGRTGESYGTRPPATVRIAVCNPKTDELVARGWGARTVPWRTRSRPLTDPITPASVVLSARRHRRGRHRGRS